MPDKELLVKVKLVSDNTNPHPSPILGTGSGGPGVGGPSATGSANASGSANPLAQASNKAAENLKTFDQHLSKAAESLNNLRESSKGMLGALKNMLPGGGAAGGGSGMLQSLMSGGKSLLGKFGMPLAVGGGALAVAGGIIHGVNAADNFMVSRGAKPWLGHGSWDRDASGSLYDWSPTRLMNNAEVAMIGGGKVNARGDIRRWDDIQKNVDLQFSEAMRRTAMQSPMESIRAQEASQLSDLRLQHGALRNSFASYRDFSLDAEIAQEKYTGGLAGQLGSSKEHLQKIHGKDIGALIAAQESFGVTQSGQAYGRQVAEAQAARKGNAMNMIDVEGELRTARSRLGDLKKNVAFGDDKQGMVKFEEENRRVLQLSQELKKIKEQDIQLQDRINALTREQVNAQKDVNAQKLSGVMQSKLAESQLLQGQKEAFGMMDVGDQQYMKDVADRFKKGGIESITSEERSMLMSSPLGEDVRIQARKRAEDSGFADIYRGSRAEARMTEIDSRQAQLEKLQVEINKTINVTNQSDKTEVAKEVVAVMGKYFSDIRVEVQALASLGVKSADNQARLIGSQKAAGNP